VQHERYRIGSRIRSRLLWRLRSRFLWHQTMHVRFTVPIHWLQRIWPSLHYCYEWDGLLIARTDAEWGRKERCVCGFTPPRRNTTMTDNSPRRATMTNPVTGAPCTCKPDGCTCKVGCGVIADAEKGGDHGPPT